MKKLLIALMLALLTLAANYSFARTGGGLEIIQQGERQPGKLNLNEASLDELVAVPGLGKVKAQAILDHIREHGRIGNELQLTNVKGIGEKLAARISQYVSFE